MANRYWVGGNGDWNNIPGLKWATSSGGAGGASVPTTSDNAIFDANSGSVNVNIVAGNSGCLNLTCTGFLGAINGSDPITISGSITLVSGMTWGYTGTITLNGNTQITSAGKTFKNITISNASCYLLSDLIAYTLTVNQGDFDAYGYNVTINNLVSSGSAARTIAIRTGVWTVTGSGNVWDCTGSNLIVYGQGQGGTIRFTVAGPLGKQFYGGGQAYPIVDNAGTGALAIYGSNGFDEIKNSVTPAVFQFQNGATQTIYDKLNVNGSAGNLAQMLSLSTGSKYYLSKSSGSVYVNSCSIKDSEVSGGATWIAVNSTDNGNNNGWIFPTEGKTMLTFFM